MNTKLNLGPVVTAEPDPMPSPVAIIQAPRKSVGGAILLDVIFGIFGIMGVGAIYTGAPVWGIALMVGFWIGFVVNLALFTVLIGFVTLPITWLLFIFVSILTSVALADEANNDTVSARVAPWSR